MRRILTLILVAGLLAACGDPHVTASQLEPSAPRTQIAFSSNRGGDFHIYIMDADGSNVRRLTDDPAWDGRPAWSPVP